MALTHSPNTMRQPLCGLAHTPVTRLANDPYTFIGIWGRKPERVCSLCLAQLRTSPQFQPLFDLIDQRIPTQPHA